MQVLSRIGGCRMQSEGVRNCAKRPVSKSLLKMLLALSRQLQLRVHATRTLTKVVAWEKQ